MKKQIFLWSVTSALAGLLFGFDTVVISGAEQTIQKLWNLSPALYGVVMGSALYGTVPGSLIGGWPTDSLTNLLFTFIGLWLIDRIGRRTLLFIGSFGYIISR